MPVAFPDMHIPILADIPVIGIILFQHDFIVYFSIFAVILVYYLFRNSHFGLIIKAVGENHDSAHALGYNVILIRFFTILLGGALAGLGGGYLSLVRVPQWTEGMTAGAGWIALALVVFFRMETWEASFRCVHFRRHNHSAAKSASNRCKYKYSYLIYGSISCNNSSFSANISESTPREEGSTGVSW